MTNELTAKEEPILAKENGSELSIIKVEHVVFALILMVATILRLGALDIIPLSPTEAANAYPVWSFWERSGEQIAIGSPIYHSLSLLVSQIMGFSDSSMRLVPVLFGLALVPLPWLLRHRLGLIGAVTASLLFALSPLQVSVSRTAGGQTVALFAGMLLFISWLRFQESGDEKWVYWLFISLGLGIMSAPIFFSIVLTGGLAWIVQSRLGPALVNRQREPQESSMIIWPERSISVRGLIIFLVVLLVAASAIFLNTRGIGAVPGIFVDWIRDFTSTGDLSTLFLPVLALGRYELIIILLGGAATLWASWKGEAFPLLLAYWLILSLIMTFLQRGVVTNLLVLTIPGFLIIGSFVNTYIQPPFRSYQIALIGFIMIFGLVIVVNIGRYVRLLTIPNTTAHNYHAFLAISFTAIIVMVVLLAWNWDKEGTRQSIIISSLILFLFYGWGLAWWMSRQAANDTRERWVSSAADGDIALVAASINEISWQLKNSGWDLTVTSTIDDPSLKWYLREIAQLDFVPTLPRELQSDALITEESYELLLDANYIGSTFRYFHPDTEHVLDIGQAIRWWLFHQSPVPVNEESLILWIRSDLLEDVS